MNSKTLVESVVVSFIVAAAFKIAYSIDNIFIVAGINIVVASISYFVLSKNQGDVIKAKKQSQIEIMELLKEQFELINRNITKTTEEHKHFNNQLIDTMKTDLIAHNEKINHSILDFKSESIDKLETINVKIMESVEYVSKQIILIENGNKLLQERLIETREVNKYLKNTLSNINTSINENKEQTKDLVNYNSCISNKMEDIIRKFDDQMDKLIDVEGNQSQRNNMLYDMIDGQREINETIMDIKDDSVRLNMEIINKLDEVIQSNGDITNRYDLIQKVFTEELLKVACKNENVVNILLDSYKLMREMAMTL